ncbi:MAG: GNAT family N-acetyltransferase [Oscillospiraceae bacterium]|nr:GNAT family N-acetyltransferase [Oscillospiraceae bacterium]
MLLKKDNLVIRQAVIADAPLLQSWWQDAEIMRAWGVCLSPPNDFSEPERQRAGFACPAEQTPKAFAELEKVRRQILACSDETFRLLIIEIDGEPVGEMNYHFMGRSTAQIGINICDSSLRGKGHGTKLVQMLTTCLFTEKGFTRIILEVDCENAPARRAYEKCGFVLKRVRGNLADYELMQTAAM